MGVACSYGNTLKALCGRVQFPHTYGTILWAWGQGVTPGVQTQHNPCVPRQHLGQAVQQQHDELCLHIHTTAMSPHTHHSYVSTYNFSMYIKTTVYPTPKQRFDLEMGIPIYILTENHQYLAVPISPVKHLELFTVSSYCQKALSLSH